MRPSPKNHHPRFCNLRRNWKTCPATKKKPRPRYAHGLQRRSGAAKPAPGGNSTFLTSCDEPDWWNNPENRDTARFWCEEDYERLHPTVPTKERDIVDRVCSCVVTVAQKEIKRGDFVRLRIEMVENAPRTEASSKTISSFHSIEAACFAKPD